MNELLTELLHSPVMATVLGGLGTIFLALVAFVWRTHIQVRITDKNLEVQKQNIEAHKSECDKLRQDTHTLIKSNSAVLRQNAKDLSEVKQCVTRVATKVESLETMYRAG